MELTLSFDRIRRWGLKGGMAILDQGIFSGSNFIVNILLARWLAPDHYGAYAVGLAISIFFLQIVISYILEPMGVLGLSAADRDLKSYLATQIKLYFVIMIPLGWVFTLAVYSSGQYHRYLLIGRVLTVIGLVLPLLFLPWVMRRVFYILGQPSTSTKGSAIYAVLLVLFFNMAREFDLLTGQSSILLIAFSALLSSAFLFSQLGLLNIVGAKVSIRQVFFENWTFGKWLLVSALLIALGGQAQIFLSGGLLGVEQAGIVSAMQVLSQPMALSVTAVTALVTPRLATDFAQANFPAMKQKAFMMSAVLTILACVYILFLFFFRVVLERVIYNGKFSDYADLIPIWGIPPLIMAIVSGFQYSLQAAKRPHAIFVATLFWVPTVLGLGLMMTVSYGIWGVAISTVLGYLVLAVIIALLYWLWLGNRGALNKGV